MARSSIGGGLRSSKALTGLIAVGAATALALSACGDGGSGNPQATDTASGPTTLADCKTIPLTCNSGERQAGGEVIYTIEKTIEGWNLNDADGNVFDTAEVLAGVLAGGPYIVPPDFNLVENPDYVTNVEVTSSNPMVITYTLNTNAKWDDGDPIDFDDYEFAWKTLNGRDCVDPATAGTLLDDDPDTNPEWACSAASTAGYEQIESLKAEGNKVIATFSKPYADWKGLFAGLYPAHIAAQHGDLKTAKGLYDAFVWFNGIDNYPTWSGGPYKISAYKAGESVTLVPNPNWWGAIKPTLDTIIFRIITSQPAEVPALQTGEVNVIYPQPNQDIVEAVKKIPGVSYVSSQGLTWEHLDFKTQNPTVADVELRKAIFTAIDREDIIAKTVGVFTEGLTPLGSHNFVPGQAGYKDLITPSGQGSGDIEKAKQILTAAGYTGVGTDLKAPNGSDVLIRFNYSEGNTLRQQTGELIQGYLADLGIEVTLNPGSLGTMLGEGNYDMIIFAWVGGPFPYGGAIQLWGSSSGSNFGGFTSEESDEMLSKAAAEPNSTVADDLLNQSNALLVEQAVVLPLFQKPTFLAAYDKIVNLRDNASNAAPTYNIQEWGIKVGAAL